MVASFLLRSIESKYKSSQEKSKVAQFSGTKIESTVGKNEQRDKASQKKVEYYDDVYFTSSSSEDGDDEMVEDQESGPRKKIPHEDRKKYRKLTNDELFYDPEMDEKDERWVRRQRMAYHNVKASEELTKSKSDRRQDPDEDDVLDDTTDEPGGPSLLKSDAVLSCPACMSTLCLDCQRHEVYKTQYRAMFVVNCSIMKDEVLRHKPNQKKRRKFRKQDDSDESEVFNPVRCTSCNTEVAVYDKDEVFHFYNVLAGN